MQIQNQIVQTALCSLRQSLGLADIDRKLPQLHDARAQKGNESSPAMIVIPLIVVQPPLVSSNQPNLFEVFYVLYIGFLRGVTAASKC